jgi:hypothetical protein
MFYWYVFLLDSMSNFNKAFDFVACYRMYKQFKSANQRLEGIQP